MKIYSISLFSEYIYILEIQYQVNFSLKKHILIFLMNRQLLNYVFVLWFM